jgi:hypothetical protein
MHFTTKMTLKIKKMKYIFLFRPLFYTLFKYIKITNTHNTSNDCDVHELIDYLLFDRILVTFHSQ